MQIPVQRNTPPLPGTTQRNGRRHKPLWAALAAVLVVGGAVTAGVALSSNSAGSAPTAAAPTTPFRIIHSDPPAAPTTTAAAAAAAATVPAQSYSGTGNDVVTLTTPVDVGILEFDCPKCSGNTTVKSNASIDADLVSKFSGSYSGKVWLGMRGGTTSRLQVTANGPWSLKVGGLDLATLYDATEPVKGTGDDVVLYRTTPPTVELTHSGKSNFSVLVMTDTIGYPDLAVNEIGKYSGRVMFPSKASDAVLVQVTADGAWTMTPS
ncbi:hypothetical protein [Pseudonocardia sp. T1-2H]|uniref:hypothetical protein n=1 Tax=Pseudonocardia sp. T1-2H TaxID=3128899 RepID=UPI003100BDBE